MTTRTVCRIPDHGLGAIRDVPLSLLDPDYLKWRLDSVGEKEVDLDAELFESSKTEGLVVLVDERPVAILEEYERLAYFELDRVVDQNCAPRVTVRVTAGQAVARLPRPGLCLPINDPPEQDWVIAPPGPLRTVIFDDDEVLDDPRRRAQVFIALRTQGNLLVVELNGRRIGKLAPEDADVLLPMAQALQDRGEVLVARAYQAPLGTQPTLTFYASPVADVSTLPVYPFTVVTSDGRCHPSSEPTIAFAATPLAGGVPDAVEKSIDEQEGSGAEGEFFADSSVEGTSHFARKGWHFRKLPPSIVAAGACAVILAAGAGAGALITPDEEPSEEQTQPASITTSQESTTSSAEVSTESTLEATTEEETTTPTPSPPPPPPEPVVPEIVETVPESFEEYSAPDTYVPPPYIPPPPPPPSPPPEPPLSPEDQFIADLESLVDSLLGPPPSADHFRLGR